MMGCLIRIVMVLHVLSVTFASSHINHDPFNIDMTAYKLRETQPSKGTIYDPIDNTQPIIWWFDPSHSVTQTDGSIGLKLDWIEVYPRHRVVMHLVVCGDNDTRV